MITNILIGVGLFVGGVLLGWYLWWLSLIVGAIMDDWADSHDWEG